MAIKSTQTNKYETACLIQEAPEYIQESERSGLTIKHTTTGKIYCEFDACMQTYGCDNRMRRRYGMHNVQRVVDNDERIQRLIYQNKWRGEWNHPNAWIKGEQYSDIRMTIPEPMNTSHFIGKYNFTNDKWTAHITTHPATPSGMAVSEEVSSLGVIPSFSVRILGNMIPNAPSNQPNINVSKVITVDMVDFPSHPNADAEIEKTITEYARVTEMAELAKYCAGQDEALKVVCESFEITPDEIIGFSESGNSIAVKQNDNSKILIPMRSQIRSEALSILKGMKK